MGLSEAGCIVADEWQRTPAVRPYVRLGAWVVMPNHVHGLIGITTDSPGHHAASHAHAKHARSSILHAHSLGAIIGQIKSICTKRIRRACLPDFAWQFRFHDHIVRNERAFRRIQTYIQNNPAQWSDDGFHSCAQNPFLSPGV
jgi:REP element-mobilizing transposase RayT